MSSEPLMAADDLAAAWFARERAGDMTPADSADLQVWLEADPEHRAALDALHRAWDRAELARHDPEILAWRERALKKQGWFQRFGGRAVAAALMVAVLGGAGTWAVTSTGLLTGYWRFSAQEFHTDHGQRATFTLPDGSKVTLNTDSQLRTQAADGKRHVYLDHGQAFFKVAHDASHPFVVHAAGRTITAIGTAFDVRVEGQKLEVTLVEGKIRVEAPVPPAPAAPTTRRVEHVEVVPVVQATEMTAGSQLVALDPRGWTVRPADTARETSWLAGRLMFENQTLATVAGEFARYTDQKIVFDDPGLADERVTGTFRSGDVGTFVRALEKYRIARVESETDDAVRLAKY